MHRSKCLFVATLLLLVGTSSFAGSTTDTFHLKDRAEFIVQGTYDLQDRYVQQFGMAAQLLYHLEDSLTLGLQGGWMFGQTDAFLYEQLANLTNLDGSPVETPDGHPIQFLGPYARYIRKPWFLSADIQWHPLQGRLAFHDVEVGHFQGFFSVGAGLVGLKLLDPNKGANHLVEVPLPHSVQFAATFGGGVRIYLGSSFSLHVELKDYVTAVEARTDLAIAPTTPGYYSSFYVSHSPQLMAGAGFVF